jgi:peroxiredoxin
MINIGDTAPDFKLKDQNENDVSLSDFKGKKVLLSFHPLAWTDYCKNQMKAIEKDYKKYEKLNVVPIGFSVDSFACKKAWAKDIGIKKLAMVADFWPHGEYAQKLGIFNEKHGFSNRANVILDENHKVIWKKEYEIHSVPDFSEVMDSLQK